MSLLYFPKPQPLSPKTKTVLIEGVRYQIIGNRRKKVKGVAIPDSIYYLWFEYLKRNDKYKAACVNNGKGMKKLYNDFGNIYEYEGAEGFWRWWNERGQFLFGIKPLTQINKFATVADVKGIEKEIENGDYKLVAIPTNLTIRTIKKRFNALIKDLEVDPTAPQTAKYQVTQTKVDVESLKSCLMAYDLKQQGLGILEIGLQVKWINSNEAKDLIEDGRRKGKEVDFEKLYELSESNMNKYNKLLRKAEAAVMKRLKRQNKLWENENYDELVDMQMGIYKINHVRTSRKKSIRTNTHKLLNKAEANIKAVGKNMFGLGH